MESLNSSKAIDRAMACSGVCPNHLKTANRPASRVPMPKNDIGKIATSDVIVIIKITWKKPSSILKPKHNK